MRLVVAAVVLMGVGAQAAEPLPPPVCADASVLRQVDEALRASGRPLVLEVPPIGEMSVGSVSGSPPLAPPLAHCAVRGHITGYDTNRYGMTPVYEPFIVNYTIELRRNGLFVSVDQAATRVHAVGDPGGGRNPGIAGVPGGAGGAAAAGRRP